MLDANVLTAELRKFMDPSYGSFVSYPSSEADAAAKWANAIDVYAGVNVLAAVYSPGPTAAGLAKAALQTGLAGMSAPLVGAAFLEAAFFTYGGLLVTGLPDGLTALGSGTHVFVPPPVAVLGGLLAAAAALVLPPYPPNAPSTSAAQLPIIAGIIDAWFRLGTATPIPPATPTPVSWA